MITIETVLCAIQELSRFERANVKYRLFYSNDLPIPQPVESTLSGCIYLIKLFSPDRWAELRSQVDEGMADSLTVYAARMASLAVRIRSEGEVLNGLMALVIDEDQVDPRDVIVSLCLLCDAAIRIQCYSRAGFKDIAQLASCNRSKLIRQYLRTRVGKTSPKMMGFIPKETPSGFMYWSDAPS